MKKLNLINSTLIYARKEAIRNTHIPKSIRDKYNVKIIKDRIIISSKDNK